MKILIVSQYFYPETFRVNTLAAELVRRGHDVTVLTGYPQYPAGRIYDGYGFGVPYEREWRGVHIERVRALPRGRTPLGLLLNCFTFVTAGKRWVRKCKTVYDAVYVFEVSPVTVGLPAVEYKKRTGVPLLFNVQDLWPESVEVVLGIKSRIVIGAINRIVDKIYSASDRILCASRGMVENIASRGQDREKLIYWPQFCAEPMLDGAKKPDEYENGCFNIVFAGNVGEAQGLDLLVDTADKLRDTNVRWFIVGDGRARDRISRRVAELGLEERVKFTGKVPESEADRYVHYADCAFLSLKKNKLFDITIPAKLQTYLACGTPILAAADGECREIVEKNGCGVACSHDPDAVAKDIMRLYSDPTALAAMRVNARNCYIGSFRCETLVKELEEIMHEVAGGDKDKNYSLQTQ